MTRLPTNRKATHPEADRLIRDLEATENFKRGTYVLDFSEVSALLAYIEDLEARQPKWPPNPDLCHCTRCLKARGVDTDRCTYEETP